MCEYVKGKKIIKAKCINSYFKEKQTNANLRTLHSDLKHQDGGFVRIIAGCRTSTISDNNSENASEIGAP